jgi:hypothetical protein
MPALRSLVLIGQEREHGTGLGSLGADGSVALETGHYQEEEGQSGKEL